MTYTHNFFLQEQKLLFIMCLHELFIPHIPSSPLSITSPIDRKEILIT
ncbi:hypothetical protein SLEP1_g13443 [Rubroshorea leprosula]|uniref:Uncharacterized protein n=1 Tax=Rubroshorea leprosula TaxID=152421 RepID=A0AAV5IRF6_9ROSI|nr:hypothetical protein SLEP1_g13443 [Rubroshorea leprosula]